MHNGPDESNIIRVNINGEVYTRKIDNEEDANEVAKSIYKTLLK
jgi:hypothetical protein